ncbi:MAG: Fic family protein [Candidatus Sedimenticola sp. PURPLELP]
MSIGRSSLKVTPEIVRLLEVMQGEMERREIMACLALTDKKHFRGHCQQLGVSLGVIEMTIPVKPRSSK